MIYKLAIHYKICVSLTHESEDDRTDADQQFRHGAGQYMSLLFLNTSPHVLDRFFSSPILNPRFANT